MSKFTAGNAGRPKGARNKATRDIQEFARGVLEDADYVAALKERIRDGKAPHMETLLAHYAYGKPKDTLVLQDAPPPFVVVVTDEPRD